MAGELHGSRELTDAVIAALEAAGLIVGDGVKPDGVQPDRGYCIVYPLTGGQMDGSMWNIHEDASVPIQVTAQGHTRRECEWVVDEVRAVMLGGFAPALTDRKVIHVSQDFAGGVIRDDDVQKPMWYSPERYEVRTSRSGSLA